MPVPSAFAPVHSLATGVLLNSLLISPLVNVIQGSITRRLIASIYDDITNSSLGYQTYYVMGKTTCRA
jgi:hypothetical protein